MRVKRYKKFQRYTSFFHKHFRFQPPFRILVDGTFANAALINKVNMKEQLPKYFDGPCKLLTTPCVIIETEKLGPSLYGAVKVLKELQIHKCQHSDSPIQASECLKSVIKINVPKKSFVNNANAVPDADDRFIIATQDANLRSDFRVMVGVPLIYLHGNAPTMEKPSDASVNWAERRDKKKLEVSSYQKEILQHMKDEAFGASEKPDKKGTRKRKRAGPNPLSCKKSKKYKSESSNNPSGSQEAEQKVVKKRKRIKVKVPKHVRELTSKV
ncbi:rRNA-processing protein UTP23 [Orchesella cincta]|uniref:rRNA-processing protein UTP23 homolog n=1 Tax=Orchesella cincta TaxID=48709 RepID=A0A1D2NC27_ORCCI|nr:rRNA-processing protein UTP23 [Orchesella cincta]